MATPRITRMTFFSVPSKADQEELTKYYEHLNATHKKDGKPYILSIEAGPLTVDPANRAKGYTFVSKSVFASQEDFDYYDTQCEAHKVLKAKVKENLRTEGPPLVTYFVPRVVASL